MITHVLSAPLIEFLASCVGATGLWLVLRAMADIREHAAYVNDQHQRALMMNDSEVDTPAAREREIHTLTHQASTMHT